MVEAKYCHLPGRGVLRLSGADVHPFLQALITRDLDDLTPERAVYGALLTPQGKYLFDFFLARQGEDLLLEGEAGRLDALAKRLGMYRLRAQVEITDVSAELRVYAAFGDGAGPALGLPAAAGSARALDVGVAFMDPRLAEAGARIIAPVEQAAAMFTAAGFGSAAAADYDYFRLCLGLPDSGRDLLADKSLLLESNFEALHGVDFDKGCFVGQELTARTKYRALVRKRLLPVRIEGPLPDPGTPLLVDEREVAVMRSGRGDRGLALVRLDRLAEAGGLGQSLRAGAAMVRPLLPAWADFELPESQA